MDDPYSKIEQYLVINAREDVECMHGTLLARVTVDFSQGHIPQVSLEVIGQCNGGNGNFDLSFTKPCGPIVSYRIDLPPPPPVDLT